MPQSTMLQALKTFTQWVLELFLPASAPPALHGMRLRPAGYEDNALMLQFFTWDATHESMSWWKHFEQEVPRLSKMGFTQVWLPPPNKAAHKEGRGYDAYDLWDLGEFEKERGRKGTRWGTREELLLACAVAREHGIDIIIDAVLNHKLGADRTETFSAIPVDSRNRNKDIGHAREIEGWTAFDFPARSGKYSTFQWTHEHFTGLDWDHKTRTEQVYRIAGKKWSHYVDKELGNYDYLLGIDIDHRHSEVRRDLFDWGAWILDTTSATGFRLDAIKHIDYTFLQHFLATCRKRSRKSDMFVVAEYWSGDLKRLQPYLRRFRGQAAFFDVPLHMNFNQACRLRTRYDLRTVLNNTIMKTRPGDAVTFVDNHDTVEGQSLESWVDATFKVQAYTLILLREEGHPCVFYGDLYPNQECYDESVARSLTLLIHARKAFAYGPTKDYFEGRNCIGFVRMGNANHGGCAVVISNKSDDESYIHTIRMHVGQQHTGSIFTSFLTQDGEVPIDQDGWGAFTCFANAVQVWVKRDA